MSYLDSDDLDPLRGYVPSPASRYPASYFKTQNMFASPSPFPRDESSSSSFSPSTSTAASTSPSSTANQQQQQQQQYSTNKSSFSSSAPSTSTARARSFDGHRDYKDSSSFSPSPAQRAFNQSSFNMMTSSSSSTTAVEKTNPPSPTPVKRQQQNHHHEHDEHNNEDDHGDQHVSETTGLTRRVDTSYDHDAYSPLPSNQMNLDDDDDDDDQYFSPRQPPHALFSSSTHESTSRQRDRVNISFAGDAEEIEREEIVAPQEDSSGEEMKMMMMMRANRDHHLAERLHAIQQQVQEMTTILMKTPIMTRSNEKRGDVDDDDSSVSRIQLVRSLRHRQTSSSSSSSLSTSYFDEGKQDAIVNRWNAALEELGVETARDLRVLMKYNKSSWESENVLKNEPLLKALCAERFSHF